MVVHPAHFSIIPRKLPAIKSVAENASNRKPIVCCLMYPCTHETWLSLVSRNRHIHEAELGHSGRNIRLMLTAMPFQLPDEELKHLLRVLG